MFRRISASIRSLFYRAVTARHDRQAVEVLCYAEVARPDAVTARSAGIFRHWLRPSGCQTTMLAERIRTDRIDILVDLAATQRAIGSWYSPASPRRCR